MTQTTIVMACCLIVLAIGTDGWPITSINLKAPENHHQIKDEVPMAFDRKYSGTRWGRSVNLEDLKLANHQQNREALIPFMGIKRGTRWGRSVNPENVALTENHQQNNRLLTSFMGISRGTRWGHSVISDEELKIDERRSN